MVPDLPIVPAPPADEHVPIILVAENDAQHRFVLQRVFRTVGLRADLHFVEDGQALLDYLEGHDPYADEASNPWPDLVLIDLHMPRRNGISALQAMRASPLLRTVPAIVFSTSDQPHHIDQAYASGANAYLVKVGDFKELVSHLRGMVAFWLKAAKLPRRPVPDAAGIGVEPGPEPERGKPA